VTPTRKNLPSAARVVSRFALILSLLLSFAGRSGAQVEAARPIPPGGLRVLFLGNSLTYTNDLPLIVQALARASGEELEVESVALPNVSLQDLWFEGQALDAIARGGWNFVVMQQGPSSLPESRVDLRKWTKKFAGRIREVGARPALYMVWPSSDRLSFFDAVSESYTLAAIDVRGMLCPAGEAWRAAWRRDPNAPLYGPDGFHPTQAGSYAAALSIYGMLFQRSPQGLPARLELADGQLLRIPRPLAKLLQDAAAEANQRFGRP
jgi:hypothetical protein